jgi:hypothetical protein
MTFLNSLRATLISALRHPRLWILQFLGNIVIVLTFALWMNLDVATGFAVFLNFFFGLILFVEILLLHGGTLNYFTQADANPAAGMGSAFKNALKHLPALAIFAAIFGCIIWLTGKLDDYQYSFPGYLRSEFPAWLRRHISEPGMDDFYLGFLGFLRWVVIPGLLLPLGLLCAGMGFRGFIGFQVWGRVLRRLSYWIVIIVAALIGVYLNSKILHWTLNPDKSTLGGQEVWFGFRLFIVYLLALLSWLWVCAMLAYTARRPDPPAASQKAAA